MIGSTELLVILILALVLFGGKKLPELAKNLGKGISEFKKATSTDEPSCTPCCQEKHLDE